MNPLPAKGDEAPVSVGIVEDDSATREALGSLFSETKGYRCALVAGSVEEALLQVRRASPNVILLDIGLPGMSGAEGVKLLKRELPDAAVLMFSVYAEDDKVFESICNGADGYLLKSTPAPRLLEAVRQVHDHGSPMSPEIARKVIRLFQTTRQPSAEAHRLTPHEVRVLGWLAEGNSYQAIADRLGVTINTVRNHVRSIYEKLHAHSKSEAVSKALRRGII